MLYTFLSYKTIPVQVCVCLPSQLPRAVSQGNCTCTCLNLAGAVCTAPSPGACMHNKLPHIFHSLHFEGFIYFSTCTEEPACVSQPQLLFCTAISSYSPGICSQQSKWCKSCVAWNEQRAARGACCSLFLAPQHLTLFSPGCSKVCLSTQSCGSSFLPKTTKGPHPDKKCSRISERPDFRPVAVLPPRLLSTRICTTACCGHHQVSLARVCFEKVIPGLEHSRGDGFTPPAPVTGMFGFVCEGRT